MNSSEILELHVNSHSVRLYPVVPQTITDDATAVAVMTPGPTSPPTPSICLLRGPLEDFHKLARHEASKWLIDLGHDICDPAQQRGSLLVWKEPEQEWNLVTSTDPLTASIYRYDLPDGTTVGLSKISQRVGRSKTKGDENASAMHDRVVSRDGRCWVTSVNEPVVNGHICPKRMGDHIARVIFETFTSLSLPPNLSIYDEIFGICLSKNIDSFFDDYEMGFRYVSPGNYECHTFTILAPGEQFTVLGRIDVPTNLRLPPLHGYPASPPCPQSDNNPPAGLFRWHYLQCVLKRFAHEDYKTLDNIHLFELPLPMEGDSDDDIDEGTDSDFEWPSKALDVGRVVETNITDREERNEAVATWIESTQ